MVVHTVESKEVPDVGSPYEVTKELPASEKNLVHTVKSKEVPDAEILHEVKKELPATDENLVGEVKMETENEKRAESRVTGSTGSGSGLSDQQDQNDKRSLRLLTVLTLGALVLGTVIGLVLRSVGGKCYWTPRRVMRLSFIGELYNRVLSCLHVPVTFSAIIASIGSTNFSSILYIFVTTWAFGTITLLIGGFFASFLLLAVMDVNTATVESPCKNGSCNFVDLCPFWMPEKESAQNYYCRLPVDLQLNVIRHHFVANVMDNFLKKEIFDPDLQNPTGDNMQKFKDCLAYISSPNRPDLHDYDIHQQWEATKNLAGVYTFAVFAALSSHFIGESARAFMNFFISLSEVTLKMTYWALWTLRRRSQISFRSLPLVRAPHAPRTKNNLGTPPHDPIRKHLTIRRSMIET